MDKTIKMFQMLDHPTEYTKEQWQEILTDPACKDLYAMLSMTTGAFSSQQAGDSLTDNDIEEAWSRLKGNHPKTKMIRLPWRNAAAIIIAVLLLTGMAWAAIQICFGGLSDEEITPPEIAVTSEALPSAPTIVTFDNVPIEQVFSELITFYSHDDDIRYEAIYNNDDVRSVRLFYQWDNKLSLRQVVDKLNHFEKIEIRMEGHKIIIDKASSN